MQWRINQSIVIVVWWQSTLAITGVVSRLRIFDDLRSITVFAGGIEERLRNRRQRRALQCRSSSARQWAYKQIPTSATAVTFGSSRPRLCRSSSAMRVSSRAHILNRQLPAIAVRIVKPEAHMRRVWRRGTDLVAPILHIYAVSLQRLERFAQRDQGLP